MQNINELMGIIKGISFDGVINERETVYVRNWLENNRNLAVNSYQEKLIKLLDKVLEDNIITMNEKDEIICYLRIYLRNNNNVDILEQELNGIINGIICDEELNDLEVLKLKKWIYSNYDYIQENNLDYKLFNFVNKLISENVIIRSKYKSLLQILAMKINHYEFDIKLKKLKNLVKEKKNIGIELIELFDDKRDINEIHRLAMIQMKKTLSSFSDFVYDPEIIYISLTIIAMQKYDSNFYSQVEEVYSALYSYFPAQKIEGLIRSVISKFKNKKYNLCSNLRIISTVLSNAIVPVYYLSSFFSFIYDIYKINFNYSLCDNLYEEFSFIYKGLKNNLSLDNDEIHLNITKKTYKLIKSTKELILDDDNIDAIIKLSILIIKLIDARFWDKQIKISNSYLLEGYKNWENSLLEEDKKNRSSIERFSSRWEAVYKLDGENIFLCPPIHKIRTQYDYQNIVIYVYNNNELMYKNEYVDIREIIGGYQVYVEPIKLDKPLGKINYVVKCADQIIYDSKDKLYRKFLVFSDKGNEIKNNTNYTGSVVFCYKHTNSSLSPYYSNDNYFLSNKNIKMGNIFLIEGTIFAFSSLKKPGVNGEEYKNHYIFDIQNNKTIKVFKNIDSFIFESSKNDKSFKIQINNTIYDLDDLSFSVMDVLGIDRYVVKTPINKPGIYKISLHKKEREKYNKVLNVCFAIDPSLDYDVLNMESNSYRINVKSSFMEDDFEKIINVLDYNENLINFKYQDRSYYYIIPFELNIYKLDNKKWNMFNNPLWINDIKDDSVLYLMDGNIENVYLYSNDGKLLMEEIKIKKNGVLNKINIGFLKTYKVNYDYVRIIIKKSDSIYKCIDCYNKCIIDENSTEFEFDSSNNILSIIPSYFGKGDIYITITDKNNDTVFNSKIENKKTIEIDNLKSFENYDIVFYEKAKGLSLNKNRIIKSYKKIFYAWDKLIGKTIKINKVYFDQFVRGEFVRKKHFLNTTYINILQKEENEFIGEIYTKTPLGNLYLDKVNPVNIDICSQPINDEVEVSISKDGDGLYLDFESHCIKNTLFDYDAVDIFSYIFSIDEVIKCNN